MSIMDAIRSWMFGKKPPPPQAEAEEVQPAAESAPVQQDPPPPVKHSLSITPDHSLRKLWTLRTEQGWLPPPELFLEGQEENAPLFPEELAAKELPRLQMAVTMHANTRLGQLRPKQASNQEEPPPTPDLNALAAAFVSGDGMTAWLLIYPPSGQGAEIARDELDRALREKQVKFGLDEKLLDALPQRPDRYFHLFLVAKGKPPVHGTDGRIVDLFPRTVEHKLSVDEHGRVDYMALDFVRNVEKDAVICRVIPPTKGVKGRTVLDKEQSARDGKAAPVPMGRNTQLSEDGTKLIASRAGHVEFSGRTFQVKPLLDIPGNVDYSTGNINFVGDVCIHGDVCSGFTVRAIGNITVDGVVEACTIEAGGDLVVARGIQGDNQAVIRTQKNLFAKYLENSCICVKETIQTDCIINCDVYCDGGVEVRSGRMTIIGGRVRAAKQVSAGIIGSRTEGRTDILLGGQPCGDFDYDQLTREIAQLEIDMEKTERQPASPDKLNRMGKMRMQLMIDRKKVEQLDKDRELFAASPPETDYRRMVCDTVFPGTVLTIGPETYRFDRQLHPCSASLAEGEIRLI